MNRRLAGDVPADDNETVDMLLCSNVKPEKLDDARSDGDIGDVVYAGEAKADVEGEIVVVGDEGPKAVLRRRSEARGWRGWKREFVMSL